MLQGETKGCHESPRVANDRISQNAMRVRGIPLCHLATLFETELVMNAGMAETVPFQVSSKIAEASCIAVDPAREAMLKGALSSKRVWMTDPPPNPSPKAGGTAATLVA